MACLPLQKWLHLLSQCPHAPWMEAKELTHQPAKSHGTLLLSSVTILHTLSVSVSWQASLNCSFPVLPCRPCRFPLKEGAAPGPLGCHES